MTENLELGLARANKHTGRRMEVDNLHKAPFAVTGIDCRTCEHWAGRWCGSVAQCVDADLYQQMTMAVQVWKRSEK